MVDKQGAYAPRSPGTTKNQDNLHVRGYKEEGTTTTPFDNPDLIVACVIGDGDV